MWGSELGWTGGTSCDGEDEKKEQEVDMLRKRGKEASGSASFI